MSRRPNILLITSDQRHWNTIGAFQPEISTPNLDRLARQGTTFDRAYCPNPTCTPSRASIITGQYPSQHGAWTLGTKALEDRHTVGESFQDAGYRTALVGKAHFQPLKSTEDYPSVEAYPILQDLEYWRNFNGPFTDSITSSWPETIRMRPMSDNIMPYGWRSKGVPIGGSTSCPYGNYGSYPNVHLAHTGTIPLQYLDRRANQLSVGAI